MHLEGNAKTINPERIEQLRVLLEKEQSRSVTHDEAENVGESLVKFFVILADNTGSQGA